MREHHLSNKEALRKFLPHQNPNSAKTIRDWKKIYKEKGPAGFFTMNNTNNTNNTNNNTTKTNNTKLTDPNMDFSNLSLEELQKVTRELLIKLCVTEREREILKKNTKIETKDKFEIVSELTPFFQLNEILPIAEMPPSTYYYTLDESKKEKEDKYLPLKELILDYWHYLFPIGYKRLTNYLKQHVEHLSKNTVKKLLDELCLENPFLKKKKTICDMFTDNPGPRKNHLKNRFKPKKPFEKFSMDMAEFEIQNTKIYLEAIIDLFSHKIVAYNYSFKKDMSFTIKTIEKFQNFLKDKVVDKQILHTDQGSNYTPDAFNDKLEELNIIHSYSKKGCPTQNSIIENFFNIFKKEKYNHVYYRSINQFIKSLENYMEFYNTERRALKDDLSPDERLFIYENAQKGIKITKEDLHPFYGMP